MALRDCSSFMRGRSAMVEHQLIVRLGPIVLQHHRGIIGFPGFLRIAAGELHNHSSLRSPGQTNRRPSICWMIRCILETLWEKFNLHHPADYQRPSMSVSDIVAIKRGGVVSCHYCDSVGFAEIPDFIAKKPSVAELEAKVKAGQTISLMDLADAAHRESGQKKSVVAQLKSQPQPERKKTAPKKSAEKEI